MDLNLHSMLSEDASFDPMLSGVSLQSLLNLNLNLNPNPSLLSDYPTLSFLTDHPPPQPQDHKPLLIPKTEAPYHPTPQHNHHHHHLTPQPQPFNFFPKRPRLDRSTYYHPTTTTYSSPDTSSSSSSPSIRAKQRPSSAIPQSNLARQRRQKLGEKTRCLQKLMPWDKKMDQATLLEEAYKYVKFLQAQVSVLQSMPETSSSPLFTVAMPPQRSNNNGGSGGVFGELERLSRNQVLQVLVNSPVAQTVMSSQGLCVFSAEQLGLLRKLSERRILFQPMNMNIVSDSKPFFN